MKKCPSSKCPSESQSFKVTEARERKPAHGTGTQLQAGMGEEKPVPVTASTSQTLKWERLFDMLPRKSTRAVQGWEQMLLVDSKLEFYNDKSVLKVTSRTPSWKKWSEEGFFCMFEVKRCIWVSHICKNRGLDLKANKDHRHQTWWHVRVVSKFGTKNPSLRPSGLPAPPATSRAPSWHQIFPPNT